MSQADIDAFLDASTPEDEAEHDDETVVVWHENAEAFEAFRHCHWEKIVNEAGIHYTGISTTEINSVCQTLRIPAEHWPRVLAGVRVCVGAAMPLMNKRE